MMVRDPSTVSLSQIGGTPIVATAIGIRWELFRKEER